MVFCYFQRSFAIPRHISNSEIQISVVIFEICTISHNSHIRTLPKLQRNEFNWKALTCKKEWTTISEYFIKIKGFLYWKNKRIIFQYFDMMSKREITKFKSMLINHAINIRKSGNSTDCKFNCLFNLFLSAFFLWHHCSNNSPD